MLYAVLFLGLGFFMLAYPEAFWFLEEWKYGENAEPSKWYLFHIRFGGAVFLILSFFGFLVSFGILKF